MNTKGSALPSAILVGALAIEAALLVVVVATVVGSVPSTAPEDVAAQEPSPARTSATRGDLDRDKDGWLNVDDPKPDSRNNLDNDALPDVSDPDDDNDGILDGRDKYPLDQNNNGNPDASERRTRGGRFDGDKDGRSDLAELREVAVAEAKKLGIFIPHTVVHLADIPRAVFQNLPEGWDLVCQDRDNDGDPDATDPFDHSFGGSYENYTHDGTWESRFDSSRFTEAAKRYGFFEQSYAVGDDHPRFDVPVTGWAGYVPGSGATTAGGSYEHFYGFIPSSEQHLYAPSGQQVQYSPSGEPIYQSPAGGFPPPAYSEGSTGAPHDGSVAPVAPPPDSGSTTPPPPPPDSGYTH